MRLDTGCEVHDLISLETVHRLEMFDYMASCHKSICICLNGEPLVSAGTISLRWKGKRFRKIFDTTFQVVIDHKLPWDVILGAQTIDEHKILKFAGFGGSKAVLPKKKKKTRGLSQSILHVCQI